MYLQNLLARRMYKFLANTLITWVGSVKILRDGRPFDGVQKVDLSLRACKLNLYRTVIFSTDMPQRLAPDTNQCLRRSNSILGLLEFFREDTSL